MIIVASYPAIQAKKVLTAGYEAKGHTQYIFGELSPLNLTIRGARAP